MATDPHNVPPKTVVQRDTVHSQTRIVADPDAANKKSWITGLAVLSLLLFVGLFWLMTKPSDVESERTQVTVNNTDLNPEPVATTTVVQTDRVVTTEPQDVQIFVTDTESSLSRLSRPDDSANQAEIEAIRRRMEDLRQADQAQSAAIQAELRESVARLESQNQALASDTSTTTSTTSSSVTTTNQPTEASAPDPQMVDNLNKRLDEAAQSLTNASQSAAPEAAARVPELNDDLADLRKQMDEALRAPVQQQPTLLAALSTDLTAFESSVQALPQQ